MEPRDAYAFALLGNVAQLQSDLDASVQNHEYALQLKPGFVVATIGLARSRYLQGDASAAHALWGGVVNDPEMAPGFRIDAAFELAGTLRGQGRFAEALLPLSNTMPLIEEEALRTAMALSELATMQYELGNIERAQELSDESLRIAPAPVTLYLFARGMMELKLERFDAVADVVERIRTTAENSDDTDPNAEKAANYLAGLSALAQGDLEAAAAPLQAAVDQPGYQYAIYNVGLARLHRATGDLETGAALAAAASGERDPGDLRLDLELDRALARLLHAEILADMGQMKAAQEEAQRFLEQWASAPAQRAELIRARQILASR
jgi:tetratricopeptide (TPR) repeat protein